MSQPEHGGSLVGTLADLRPPAVSAPLPTPSAPRVLSHEPALDGLRAVAVLAVMMFHFTPIVRGGAQGVDVFFVLSGWLITTILVREIGRTGAVDYRAFLDRRARRLIPALAVLLAAYVIWVPAFAPEWAARRWYDAVTAALYLTNIRDSVGPANTPLAHSWSLAVEAQFYLLFPLILTRLLRRGSTANAATSFLATWAALTILRTVWAVLFPGDPATYYATPLHATGLFLGAAAALNPARFKHGSYALAALVLVMLAADSRALFLATTPVVEVAAALVILNPPAVLTAGALRWTGKVSYGIYLWHVPLQFVLGEPTTVPDLVLLVGASLLAGSLSYLLVERRFLRRPRPGLATG